MNIPTILINPNRLDFFVDEKEINYLKDAKKYLIRKYYRNTLSLVFKALINNLKRRIEIYGIYEFIESIDINERNRYFRKDDTLTRKLELLNSQIIITKCFELQIIHEKTYNIIKLFNWFYKNCDETQISKDELNSMLTLLETNLFKVHMKHKAQVISKVIEEESTNSERKNSNLEYSYEDITNLKRRKTDILKTRKSKKLKKEDIFIMQNISLPRRRKDDFLHSHDVALKRKQFEDKSIYIPRRRKEDKENYISTPRRRKDDWILENHPRRRKEDLINSIAVTKM